jgi:hypothetical protein
VKPEWTGLALIYDVTTSLDEVEAVRPTCVGSFNVIVETIDDGGKFDAQLAHTNASYRCALLFVARTAEKDLISNVALHCPDVSWVRFEDVDGVEINLTLVLLGQFVQGGNLPPKWRSGIAAENQHDRFFSPE